MAAKISKHDVELLVSNQSPDLALVDIEITVDERSILRKEFAAAPREMAQHDWTNVRMTLAEGRHRIAARSRKGKARIEQTFDLPGVRSIMVGFWRDEASASSPATGKFTIQMSSGPAAAM